MCESPRNILITTDRELYFGGTPGILSVCVCACVCVYVFVKTHQNLHLKCVHFIIHKLYFNKIHFLKRSNLLNVGTASILVLLGEGHLSYKIEKIFIYSSTYLR